MRGRGANRANTSSDGQGGMNSPMPPPQHTPTLASRAEGQYPRNDRQVRADERSVPGANEIMRSDQKNEAAEMDRVNEEKQVQSKSEDLTVSAARRGVVIGRAADGMVNGKANGLAAKEQVTDRDASLANNARGENRGNHAKASLIAALAMRVAHQEQGGKSATVAAEAEVETQETTAENESVILRTKHTAT
ncbi:THO2 plays a role in transcriptional elongation [Ascochyta clinopodiicola]|nr:THO2 plays a role in transcriptional elongation [Ascochyta clinopodiicola]